MQQILDTFEEVQQVEDKPQMIIAHTLKGKGLSPFEKDETNRKHGKPLTEDEKEIALAELDEMYHRTKEA